MHKFTGTLIGVVVPNRLRVLRDAAGISRRQLAAELATTERTIFRYEAGESAMSDEFKLAAARRFAVSVADLMGWPEGRPPDAA